MRFFSLFLILVLWGMVMAGNHYDAYPESSLPFSHTHDHSICYGYAMARALGKTTGDVFCPPEITYVTNGIDESLFPYVDDPTLQNIKVGDIVVFGQIRSQNKGHAAFVVYVPNPLAINDIRVDQVPNEYGAEQKDVRLETVIYSQGQPVGYHIGHHGLKAAVTFRNSFLAGILHVDKNKFGDWITRNHGDWVYFGTVSAPDLNKGSSGNIEIEAIDHQMSNGYKRKFRRWEKDYQIRDLTISNPGTITVSGSKTYTAYFVKEFNVTLQNDFGSGQIALNDTNHSAPHSQIIFEDHKNISVKAINQQVSGGKTYYFKKWQDGTSANPKTFTINAHQTITAHFDYVQISGPTLLDYNESGTFTTTATVGNGIYSNYKWWWRNDGDNSPIANPNGITPMAPSIGYWNALPAFDGHSSITLSRQANFSLKCEVTTTLGNTFTDEHSVAVFSGIIPFGANGSFEAGLENMLPKSFKLDANYPNPFNPVTTIRYALPEASAVVLDVYSLSGQKVVRLQNGVQQAGNHAALFDGANLASGIYLYRFSALGQKSGKRFNAVKRMLLIK